MSVRLPIDACNATVYTVAVAVLLSGLTACSNPQFRGSAAATSEWAAVPTGQFNQGDTRTFAEQVPVHKVTIRKFLLARHEVTRGQFAAFVAATGYQTEVERGTGCYVVRNGDPVLSASSSWRNPGFPQTDTHPVVCVTWADAQAYVRWLSVTTGLQHRLPTESEFEYATRAGSTTPYPWGDTLWHDTRQCGPGGGNVRDLSAVPELSKSSEYVAQCSDGYVFTAPVGRYGANSFGLFDMNGNVSEWIQDCYRGDRYDNAPTDGSAWEWEGCEGRGIRGGNWVDSTPASSSRGGSTPQMATTALSVVGFRVARSD